MKPTPDLAEILAQLRCASRVRTADHIPQHLSQADCKIAADAIERLRDEIKRLCRIPVRSADEHINTVMERNIRKAMQEPDPEGTP